MLFYYEQGNIAEFKVPDVFVVKGIAKHDRRVYKLWEEQQAPCVVFEITSRGTRLEDLGTKRALYEMLGVRESYARSNAASRCGLGAPDSGSQPRAW